MCVCVSCQEMFKKQQFNLKKGISKSILSDWETKPNEENDKTGKTQH